MSVRRPNEEPTPNMLRAAEIGLAAVAQQGRWYFGDRLRKALGPDVHKRLTARQRDALTIRLEILDAHRAYLGIARPGPGLVTATSAAFCAAVPRIWLVRISRGTLYMWRRRFRLSGVEGLIDWRGRPQGRAPLDAGLSEILIRLMAHGLSIQAAHRRVADIAREQGKRWVSFRSLHERLATGERLICGPRLVRDEDGA